MYNEYSRTMPTANARIFASFSCAACQETNLNSKLHRCSFKFFGFLYRASEKFIRFFFLMFDFGFFDKIACRGKNEHEKRRYDNWKLRNGPCVNNLV